MKLSSFVLHLLQLAQIIHLYQNLLVFHQLWFMGGERSIDHGFTLIIGVRNLLGQLPPTLQKFFFRKIIETIVGRICNDLFGFFF